MTNRLAIAAVLAIAVLPSPARADATADLELGVARIQAGEYEAAIAPLRAAHEADPSDLDTALLLGIAYFRCDDAATARPFLEAAARSPDPETRDGARILLGLVADSAGDAEAAIGYYDSVARSASSFAASGRQLLARQRGRRFAAALVIRPEFDSNVAALPTVAAPTDGSARDRDLFVIAELRVQPFEGRGLVLDQAVAYRKQEQLTDYDMASSVSGTSWSVRSAKMQGALAYHLDLSTLGGKLFQIGHTVDAGARRAVTGALGVGASYQLAARTLYPDGYTGYSGAVHTGAAKLSWLGGAWELELAGIVARESTADPTLSALAAGGQLAARLRVSRADLRVSARAMDRSYDEAAQGRRDLQLRGDAALFVEIASHLGAVVGATLLDDRSNAMDASYSKWTLYLGAVIATAP
jgi:tetratricopeptide (TPR) repeat protein